MRQTRCTWSSGFSLYLPGEACVRWVVRLGMEQFASAAPACFCLRIVEFAGPEAPPRFLPQTRRDMHCPKERPKDTGSYASAISAIGPVFLDPWRGLNLR